MLAFESLGIEFANRWLVRHASYQFLAGERIGLVGRNGTGKSTLLKILSKQLTPSEGAVHTSSSLKLAFFNQDLLSYETDRSIVEVAKEAFAPVLALKAEIDDLLERVENGESDPAIWDDLVHKQELFDTQGGNQIDADVHGMLSGLGFTAVEHHQPYATFSGGWRMRVLLARMLLQKPDILLLDEPTNHLDLPSIEWLENYLKQFKGTVVIVSHDRFFLDKMVTRVLEIRNQRLHTYTGNYSFFLTEKVVRIEQQAREYEKQQQEIREHERFIQRFKAKASKAAQAQSRVKTLERMVRIMPPESDAPSMNLRFQVKTTPGREIVKILNASKAYGDKKILENSSATIERGDKIALIGANGTGKSTLLRIIAGAEEFQGEHKLGHNVESTFFAQHQLEALGLDNRILEEAAKDAPQFTETEVRSILGCFMFSGDDSDKFIRVLSGGEKSRVALAKTLMSRANFLLLDEPTNHLDIQSIQVLIQALTAYEGSFVIVSHDRFFLREVANKIWYIEDRQLKEYPGTYEEYDIWMEGRLAKEKEAAAPKVKAKAKPVEKKAEKAKKNELSWEESKKLKNRLRKLTRIQEQAESRMIEVEEAIEKAELNMADPAVAADFSKLEAVQAELKTLRAELVTANDDWEGCVEEMEELENKLG